MGSGVPRVAQGLSVEVGARMSAVMDYLLVIVIVLLTICVLIVLADTCERFEARAKRWLARRQWRLSAPPASDERNWQRLFTEDLERGRRS